MEETQPKLLSSSSASEANDKVRPALVNSNQIEVMSLVEDLRHISTTNFSLNNEQVKGHAQLEACNCPCHVPGKSSYPKYVPPR